MKYFWTTPKSTALSDTMPCLVLRKRRIGGTNARKMFRIRPATYNHPRHLSMLDACKRKAAATFQHVRCMFRINLPK
jgi:hypothetical protein